jgi:hypothetical protein
VLRRGLHIALVEAASTSKTSVNFCHTTCRIKPDNSHIENQLFLTNAPPESKITQRRVWK